MVSGGHVCGSEARGCRFTYQKCTVFGPMGLFQNFWKPPGASGPAAVLTRRRACARSKKGRKERKMRAPGRKDMAVVRDGGLVGGRTATLAAVRRTVDGCWLPPRASLAGVPLGLD